MELVCFVKMQMKWNTGWAWCICMFLGERPQCGTLFKFTFSWNLANKNWLRARYEMAGGQPVVQHFRPIYCAYNTVTQTRTFLFDSCSNRLKIPLSFFSRDLPCLQSCKFLQKMSVGYRKCHDINPVNSYKFRQTDALYPHWAYGKKVSMQSLAINIQMQ